MANEDILLSRIRVLLLVTPAAVIIGLLVLNWFVRRPDVQPINFSHVLHAGQREIDCKYCHRGVEKGMHAGVPSVQDCWNCHQGLVKDGHEGKDHPVINQPEIQKLLKEYVEVNKDINWYKNYDLPEHVHFSHRSHINAGVACETCHGNVKEQAVIKLNQTLSMGWCIGCHRQNNAPVDCTTCHY